MEELEGYLQCFDEKDREAAKVRLAKYMEPTATAENLRAYFLRYAFYGKKHDLLHKLIDLGCGRTPGSELRVENHPFDATNRIMYDRGFISCRVKPGHVSKLVRFLDCRDCARSAAIAVLSLFSDGDRKSVV